MRGISKDKYGYVITYFPEKGYGFICDNDEEDEYFFHISNLEKPFDIIPYKTKVVFRITENAKGLCAVNIRKYTPEIKGEFGRINLPNLSQQLTNKESYDYLKKQQDTLTKVCKNVGINIVVGSNEWITLDDDLLEDVEDITPENGKWEINVPSGYPDTFEYVYGLLQKQITYLNRAYVTAAKGIQGEEKTKESLKAVSINYPVLHNVLLEEGVEDNRFSAENDTIIITDRAIFLVETKNFGGKGDKITISEDGRWEIFDKYQKKSFLIKNNPYKQVTDHIFVMKKFMESHGIKEDLPVIPIIAIANNDVNIEIKNNELTKVLRTELLGSYILQYLESHISIIPKETMIALSNIFDGNKIPSKKYKVINYFENINVILNNLMKLIEYYEEDLATQYVIDEELKEKERLEEEQKLEAEEERIRKQKEEELERRRRQSERDKKRAEEEKQKSIDNHNQTNQSTSCNNEGHVSALRLLGIFAKECLKYYKPW